MDHWSPSVNFKALLKICNLLIILDIYQLIFSNNLKINKTIKIYSKYPYLQINNPKTWSKNF